MTNPTSNFGWQMPTSTDLVTDLPADFEVFGQAVDTSLADLKGGTTGQVLAKATATDMDFVWTTPTTADITAVNVTSPITGGGSSGDVTIGIQAGSTTQSGAVQLTDSVASTSITTAATPNSVKTSYDLAAAAIAKSTATTKGDLLAATAASTITRLGVGTDGQFLTAASGQATGLQWTTLTSAATANFSLLNSGSTTLPAATTYTLSGLGGNYTQFAIFIQGASTTAANDYISIRLNASSATNYQSFGQKVTVASSYTATGVFGSYSDTAATQWYIAKMSANAASTINGGMQIFGGKTTGTKVIMGQGAATTSTGADPEYYNIHGFNNALAATITSISIISSGGNFDAGSVFIYGTA